MLLSMLALAAVLAAAQDAPPAPAASPSAEAAPPSGISAGTGKAAAATTPAPAEASATTPAPTTRKAVRHVRPSAATESASAESGDAPVAAEPGSTASAPSAPPQSASALVQAGLNAYRKRRYAAAEIEFRRALDADPSNAAAAYYLGYTYYKQAERKRPFHAEKQHAAELFARAYELDAHFAPTWGR